MRAYQRLLEYVKTDTQSAEDADRTPSTPKQTELSKALAAEMERMGMEAVFMDEHAYVYGSIPPSSGMEDAPVVGFIAHVDTAPDFSGADVSPQIIKDYDGRDVALGNSGRVLENSRFPHLLGMKGQTLIVTDGNSLLGADDKAGIAEIMTACERLLTDDRPHCGVAVCFTPDEEIGHGAALLDLDRFGADFAFTIDGDAPNDINYETFNASSAVFEICGVSVHPGSAKDLMVNASLVAMEISTMLPARETPAGTQGYEGFYHLTDMKGNVERSTLKYIIRDHDAAAFERRCQKLRDIRDEMERKYGGGIVSLEIKPQYRNMAEVLRDKMTIVARAEAAIRKAGLNPVTMPVRGGTDGAQLSFRGLPCPNLGTGGYGFHGPYEHISVENMDTVVDIILNLITDERG